MEERTKATSTCMAKTESEGRLQKTLHQEAKNDR